MTNPILFDLFCKAGGASKGYSDAGFDVVGCDIEPQPNYPFPFAQGDALEILRILIDGGSIVFSDGRKLSLDDIAAFGGSPPCQFDSIMSRGRWKEKRLKHKDLIKPTKSLLVETGRPYVIENVSGARHKYDSHLMLCGTMFGLQSDYGNQLRRHRYFEVFPHVLILPPPCAHNKLSAIGVFGGGQHPNRRKRSNGSGAQQKDDSFGVEQRKKAMGIDWMIGSELNQAIPPAYTEYIGRQLRGILGI